MANFSGVSTASGKTPWWIDTVGYQIYIRSFADSNGDGVGDLAGITDHLGYLELLGIRTIWITPFYPSPMADAGYDVSDPRDVDPAFGTLADFDVLVDKAHLRGLKVVIDLVPNHTSSAHPWFQAALTAGPGSAQRDRYLFRDGSGPAGERPPNNWASIFGGPSWTRVADGQWYLHLFDAAQPDLNWRNVDVREDLRVTLKFWLDRGVDGFRIDVAHGMSKPEGLPDAPDGHPAAFDREAYDRAASEAARADDHELEDLAGQDGGVVPISQGGRDPRFDDDGVHEVHRFIRGVVEDYRDRMTVGEVWVDEDRFAAYIRPDELHQAFAFPILEAAFDANEYRSAITSSLASARAVGSLPVWTLSNHDKFRTVTRFGGGQIGLARARAAMLMELALPGAVYLYNGEELGLPSIDIPDDALQDPTWVRSGFTERGRDNCRLPLPWEGPEAPYGFSTSVRTWLPVPPEYAPLTVENQLEDAHSTLNLVRTGLELRATRPEFAGDEIEWYGAPENCFAFRRRDGGLVCVLNSGDTPVVLPPGDLLLASAALDSDGLLPGSAAAWLVPATGR
ncbi:glycoside hydrolase family 13 protein [Nakamurella sp. PAMC28650]|uniref:glycoside hydrolase family 13 protein n=1 Tax=Nakamurella sp. PAMC28650 TaxID=2762325 RepID=UPI00164E53F5|nr:glycoside hydrolase family 13 protein [Nakamurella sp. PAMC28650]